MAWGPGIWEWGRTQELARSYRPRRLAVVANSTDRIPIWSKVPIPTPRFQLLFCEVKFKRRMKKRNANVKKVKLFIILPKLSPYKIKLANSWKIMKSIGITVEIVRIIVIPSNSSQKVISQRRTSAAETVILISRQRSARTLQGLIKGPLTQAIGMSTSQMMLRIYHPLCSRLLVVLTPSMLTKIRMRMARETIYLGIMNICINSY